MGRLIDADTLLNDFSRYPGEIDREIYDMVHGQPTSYDVDKVVERLESRIENTWEHNYLGGRKDALNEAIEIVKGGGK